MRNTLLKAAPWIVLVSASAALGVWLLVPVQTETAQPQDLPPSAAASPALTPSAPSAAPNTADTPHSANPLSAEQLTDRAKQQIALDPEAALADITRADQLAGSQHEVRRVLEIHALVRLGKVGLARTLTDKFYRTFPNSQRAAELERLTGYHPRPSGP